MKAGIVAEDYKVPLFEKELTKAGFKFTKAPFMKPGVKYSGITAFKVECTKAQIGQLHTLCARVQSEAWHQKAKEN